MWASAEESETSSLDTQQQEHAAVMHAAYRQRKQARDRIEAVVAKQEELVAREAAVTKQHEAARKLRMAASRLQRRFYWTCFFAFLLGVIACIVSLAGVTLACVYSAQVDNLIKWLWSEIAG